MNYKRKKPSYRKYRHLRRGYNGLGKDLIRKQIDRDHFNNILESLKLENLFKKNFSVYYIY